MYLAPVAFGPGYDSMATTTTILVSQAIIGSGPVTNQIRTTIGIVAAAQKLPSNYNCLYLFRSGAAESHDWRWIYDRASIRGLKVHEIYYSSRVHVLNAIQHGYYGCTWSVVLRWQLLNVYRMWRYLTKSITIFINSICLSTLRHSQLEGLYEWGLLKQALRDSASHHHMIQFYRWWSSLRLLKILFMSVEVETRDAMLVQVSEAGIWLHTVM